MGWSGWERFGALTTPCYLDQYRLRMTLERRPVGRVSGLVEKAVARDMRSFMLLIGLLAFSCRGMADETNAAAPALARLFVFAPLELRAVADSPEARKVALLPPGHNSADSNALVAAATLESVAATNQFSLPSREFSAVEAALYERLLEQGFFSRPASVSDDPFDRWAETIFAPSFVHWGKVDVSCTVLTAIQRKNPLCLLNPIFFQMTW